MMDTIKWRMRDFALLGAKVRLAELEAEVRTLYELFPELKEPAPGAKRERRKLTAAEKRVISDRMKAPWAKRKGGAR